MSTALTGSGGIVTPPWGISFQRGDSNYWLDKSFQWDVIMRVFMFQPAISLARNYIRAIWRICFPFLPFYNEPQVCYTFRRRYGKVKDGMWLPDGVSGTQFDKGAWEMNNMVFIIGKIARISLVNASGRDMLGVTVCAESYINGKGVPTYIPVQVTIPNMVQKYQNLAIGTRVSVEGRFETYRGKDGITHYNVTQLTSFQPVDEGDFNHAVIWGRITSDIRTSNTQGGHRLVSFSIANSRSYKKNDEWVEVTSFIPVTAWDTAADMVGNLTKGNAVWVTGRLYSRSYENKDGVKVYVTELNADSVVYGGTGRRNIVDGGNENSNGNSSYGNMDGSYVPQSSWEYEQMSRQESAWQDNGRHQDNDTARHSGMAQDSRNDSYSDDAWQAYFDMCPNGNSGSDIDDADAVGGNMGFPNFQEYHGQPQNVWDGNGIQSSDGFPVFGGGLTPYDERQKFLGNATQKSSSGKSSKNSQSGGSSESRNHADSGNTDNSNDTPDSVNHENENSISGNGENDTDGTTGSVLYADGVMDDATNENCGDGHAENHVVASGDTGTDISSSPTTDRDDTVDSGEMQLPSGDSSKLHIPTSYPGTSSGNLSRDSNSNNGSSSPLYGFEDLGDDFELPFT